MDEVAGWLRSVDIAAIVQSVYQNQRRKPSAFYLSQHTYDVIFLTDSDMPSWCTDKYEELVGGPDNVALPEGYTVLNNWAKINTSECTKSEDRTDIHGWRYAAGFQCALWFPSSTSECSVRRRMHQRVLVPTSDFEEAFHLLPRFYSQLCSIRSYNTFLISMALSACHRPELKVSFQMVLECQRRPAVDKPFSATSLLPTDPGRWCTASRAEGNVRVATPSENPTSPKVTSADLIDLSGADLTVPVEMVALHDFIFTLYCPETAQSCDVAGWQYGSCFDDTCWLPYAAAPASDLRHCSSGSGEIKQSDWTFMTSNLPLTVATRKGKEWRRGRVPRIGDSTNGEASPVEKEGDDNEKSEQHGKEALVRRRLWLRTLVPHSLKRVCSMQLQRHFSEQLRGSAIKEGPLLRMRPLGMGWLDVWGTLSDNRLSILPNKSAAPLSLGYLEPPSFDLSGLDVRELHPNETVGCRYGFGLCKREFGNTDNNMLVVLGAKSKEERDEWVAALTHQLAILHVDFSWIPFRPMIHDAVVLSSDLWKRRATVPAWSLRTLDLRASGLLVYYDGVRMRGKFDLIGCEFMAVRAPDVGGICNVFQISTRDRNVILLRAMTQDVQQQWMNTLSHFGRCVGMDASVSDNSPQLDSNSLLPCANSASASFSPHLFSAIGLRSRSLSVSAATFSQVYPHGREYLTCPLESIELVGLQTEHEKYQKDEDDADACYGHDSALTRKKGEWRVAKRIVDSQTLYCEVEDHG